MACSCGNTCSDCRQNGGLITQGSGRIDPRTGNLRLTVDDVPGKIRETGEQIIVGKNEYIINSATVRKLGVPFLDNLNAIGLNSSDIPAGTGNYGNYQQGGDIQQNNQVNFQRRRRPFRRQKMRPGRPHREMGGMVQQDDNLDWKRRHRRRKRDETRPPTRGRQYGGIESKKHIPGTPLYIKTENDGNEIF